MNELPPDILHCIGNASLLACATPRVAVICQRRTWPLAPERLLNFQGIGKRCNLEKHGWRNIKSFAQFLDVRLIEGTFLRQDLGHDAFKAKDGDQIFLAEIIRIDQRAKDFDRRSIRNGIF